MKVHLPIVGKATGSSAGLIYQSYWGNTYTRSFPFSFHYPDTKKQQQCQATFFDLQRIWLPIYDQLSKSIQRMQRKNKNPFNVFSSFVYKIFKPYKLNPDENRPSYFGLDPKNRVVPNIVTNAFSINEQVINLGYIQYKPKCEIDFDMDTLNVILFNLTLQSMYFQTLDLVFGKDAIKFENTNEWKSDNVVLLYAALSCDSWLGNFNKIELWLK